MPLRHAKADVTQPTAARTGASGAGRRSRAAQRIGRLAACWCAAALILACGPVFIPVPPPAVTTFTRDLVTDSQGTTSQVWITAGGPEPRAANGTYYVVDQQRGAGVIATASADGSYQAPAMAGTEGDHVLVNYKDSRGKMSATACLILSELRPAAASCP